MKLNKFFGKDADKVVALTIKMYEIEMGRGRPNIKSEVIGTVFAKLCAVAKLHHCRIEWCGYDSVRCPDRFIVYKCGIAYLTNIDTIRYDGIYARCSNL